MEWSLSGDSSLWRRRSISKTKSFNFFRILKQPNQIIHEPCSLRPVNCPVVISQGKRHHLPYLYLPFPCSRLFHYSSNPQNACFRVIQYRGEEFSSYRSQISDCK